MSALTRLIHAAREPALTAHHDHMQGVTKTVVSCARCAADDALLRAGRAYAAGWVAQGTAEAGSRMVEG